LLLLTNLDDEAIERAVFGSVPDLIRAIKAYLTTNNNDPKGFVRTAPAEQIHEKVLRGRSPLEAAMR
jgi:hypothetical protein